MEANENQTLIDVGCALNGPETLENGKIPFVVVPEGYKVADLEHLLPEPTRKRAAVQARDADGFCHYLPTTREMECAYDDAVEELLIENRRGLIQVTGRVVLDDAGAPKKIIDVNDIRELDLSPLAVDTVRVGDLTLEATREISLEPATDETQQLICVSNSELGIDAYARTREVLVGELNEQIGMLWQEYARAPDDTLDGEAIKMKQALLAAFSEVAHAAELAELRKQQEAAEEQRRIEAAAAKAEQQRAIQAEKDAKEAAERAERERVEAEQQAKQTEESRRIADRLELIRLQCSGMYYWQLDEVLCAIEELLAKWAGEQ